MSIAYAEPPAAPPLTPRDTGGQSKPHYQMVDDGDIYPLHSFQKCAICWCEPGQKHRHEYH